MAKTKKPAINKTKTSRKSSNTRKKPTGQKTGEKAPVADATESKGMVGVDRRSRKGRRDTPDRRKNNEPAKVERRTIERRAKVTRRRQIDPTTCERDYSVEEIEFMNALDAYKRTSGRMFPTCSEILEVLKNLGYEKRPETTEPAPPEPAAESEPVEQKAAV